MTPTPLKFWSPRTSPETMSSETHESPNASGHGDYERRDIGVRPILYFIAGLIVAAVLIHLLLAGLYEYLDKRENANQPPVNPLVSSASTDTRHVSPKYPDAAFPDPRLETDERTQLNDIRLAEEQKLNSYDWIDQKAGTVRIPIDRAIDLVAQRGLPVRPQEAAGQTSAPEQEAASQGKKEKRSKAGEYKAGESKP
jgi:hypothetical protein